MDYKALLVKYLARVIDCEGATFISKWAPYTNGIFTEQEAKELKRLAKQAKEEYDL